MSGIDWPWSRGIRPLLQAEAAECAHACLAMVANHYGHRLNLPGLRQLYPTSMKGTTLAELMALASDLELSPRAVRLELEELGQLQLPAILHWDLNHFVVLEKVGRDWAMIVDPACGRRRMPLKKLGRHFTGVALELSPTPDFRPVQARTKTRLSDLWSRLVNFRGAFLQILGLSLLLQLTALILPFFLQLTVDEAIGQGDTNLLLVLFVAFGAIYLVSGVTEALRSWVVLTLGQSLSFQLSGNVIRHLLRLPVAYFERRHIGDLLSRVGSIQPIRELLTQGIVNALIDFALAITTLVVMWLIHPGMAMIVLATTLVYLGIGLLLYPGLRRRTEEEIIARAGEGTYLMESIRAIRAVKLHSSEALRENGWRNRHAEVVSASYRAQMFGIHLNLAESLLTGFQLLLVVYVGALAVLGQDLTVGLLFAFLAYRTSFTGSAVGIIDQIQSFRLLGVHLERLSDITGERREELRVAHRRQLLPGPAIAARELSFAYSPAEPPIFEGLELDVPAGGFVAIVGPSGAGKTTLLRVLLGLLQPTGGRILIDEVPLGPATNAAWRARIGAVMQDDVLLSGTLADNIAFFDPELDQKRVETAARLARIHEEIVAMPMGYQSLISDMGSALSGGQKQRILLARALYRDPDALFLDEGTANLDEANEAAIADMIAGLPITRIVIAHRAALIERADMVLRLDGGRIEVERRPEAALGQPA
jgi:ATP-binding cassette, subfamily B, bacterial CvaB/MchF/RaxB